MNDLKELITDRISNILELHLLASRNETVDHAARCRAITKSKKSERYRVIRESELLVSLNYLTLTHTNLANQVKRTLFQLYDISVHIMASYDPEYLRYKDKFSASLAENFRKLYCDFFNSNGFAEKSKLVTESFQKGFSALSPAMLLGWISEWSKHQYCELLQVQNENSPIAKDRMRLQSLPKPEKQRSSETTIKTNEEVIVEIGTTISSLPALYGLFLDELMAYYRQMQILQVDFNYLRSIRKSGRKKDLLTGKNMGRLVEVIKQKTGNKQISAIMKTYDKKWTEKYPEFKNKVVPKTPVASPKKVLSPVKLKPKVSNPCEGEDCNESLKSKLLSPHFSAFQFLKPCQMEQRIKKLDLVNHMANNKRRFPEIRQTPKPFKKFSIFNSPSAMKNEYRQAALEQCTSSFMEPRSDWAFLKCEIMNQNRSELQARCVWAGSHESEAKVKDMGYFQYDDDKLKITKNFDGLGLKKYRKATIAKRAD